MNETIQTWRAILTPDRLRREDVVELRDRRLRRLVAHAYQEVAHYRRIMDAHGIHPDDIRTADDLRRFPVTTRDDMRFSPAADVVASGLNPDRLHITKTSGSTGQPLAVRRTNNEVLMERVRWFGMLLRYGLGPRDRRVAIRTLHREGPGILETEKRQLLYPHLCLHCGLAPEDILRRLRAYRPDFLCSYAGTLALLANHVTEADRRAIRPRVILSGSEVLTPAMRAQVERAFGAPVREIYATIEHNLIGMECDRTGEFHVRDDDVIIEISVDGRPAAEGERGEVYVTNLHARSMPFIRYRLGDIVTMGRERCSCGAPFSTIRRVEGRVLDRLELPGGRFLHPYDITNLINLPGVGLAQFQLVQEHETRIALRLALSQPLPDATRTALQSGVERLLGPGVLFRIDVVDRIPPGPGGKYRVCHSLVNMKEPPR